MQPRPPPTPSLHDTNSTSTYSCVAWNMYVQLRSIQHVCQDNACNHAHPPPTPSVHDTNSTSTYSCVAYNMRVKYKRMYVRAMQKTAKSMGSLMTPVAKTLHYGLLHVYGALWGTLLQRNWAHCWGVRPAVSSCVFLGSCCCFLNFLTIRISTVGNCCLLRSSEVYIMLIVRVAPSWKPGNAITTAARMKNTLSEVACERTEWFCPNYLASLKWCEI